MTKRLGKIFSVVILLGLIYQPLYAQEDILKAEVAGKHKNNPIALYASTLRMINIGQNQDYNDLVSGIEKILIYRLDSATQANKTYLSITTPYREKGYEEYAMASGKELNMIILGKEEEAGQYVGYLGREDFCVAFYITGNIGWEKIPKLVSTIQGDDFINLLDFK